ENRSERFCTFCYPAKCPSGHRRFTPMFKIAPSDFVCFAGQKFIPLQLNAFMVFLPLGHA
ncbi:hypothetical protein, partial [Rheinheimera sediminis]|uniref:hypothetical protein n=1 Tax=Rheinheimera sp. YQF-1 TaxID=2499626 RepID=UPI001C974324